MEPQYPAAESVVKPEPRLKNISWQLGKGMHHIYDGSTFMADSSLNKDSKLSMLEDYCRMLAWVQDCRVVVELTWFDRTASLITASPEEFSGEVDVTIIANQGDHIKERCVKVRISDTERLDSLVLDRFYGSTSLIIILSIPGDNEHVTLYLHNQDGCTLRGPRKTYNNIRGEQTRNYRECYTAVDQVIADTTSNNFNGTTGIFSYLLMNFYILDVNRIRLEASLRKTGWSHVKFIDKNQYTLLELK